MLDAISQIGGLTRLTSKRIWIARPTPGGCDQRLVVNWADITEKGETKTNYQIMPGDRIYMAENKLIALDSFMGKILNPVERVFGIATLGSESVFEVKNPASSFR